MKIRIRRIVTAAIVFVFTSFCVAGWATVKVIAWARDLPNRIVVDGDALGQAIADAVTHSYHEVLTNGDLQTQIQALHDFTEFVGKEEAARTWIRTEYSSDLEQLASSPNTEVAFLANELLNRLRVTPLSSKQRMKSPTTGECCECTF